MKRTRIPRRSPNYARKHRVNEAIKREKAKRRNGVPGKAGIVRLKGEKLEALRRSCFERDGYRCQALKYPLTVVGDVGVWAKCLRPVTWETGEMAHIHAKRNGGDTLENVRTLCKKCHELEHHYGKDGKKPCPAKDTHDESRA